VDNPAITKSADHSPKIATALNGAKIDTDGLNVVELAYTGKVNLRGDFESSAVNSQLTSLLGMESKVAPNTYTSNGANTLFWLGPDERLLYTDNNTASIIEQWRGHPATAAVDVSDYLIVLQLSGAKTRDVIASGAPFDVHPDVFRVGQCAQTRFGNASILLSNQADTPVFQLQVRWSFAEYVYEYIKRVEKYV